MKPRLKQANDGARVINWAQVEALSLHSRDKKEAEPIVSMKEKGSAHSRDKREDEPNENRTEEVSIVRNRECSTDVVSLSL
jgi:hypothetical protein